MSADTRNTARKVIDGFEEQLRDKDIIIFNILAKIKELEDRVIELTIIKDTYEDWNKKLKAKLSPKDNIKEYIDE